MRKPALLGLVFIAVVIGVIVYSTIRLAENRVSVEVCMQFNGATSCRTASGQTRDLALRAATENACALIASGVTDSQACTRSEPVSVRWLK
jgi:hypothetical protein